MTIKIPLKWYSDLIRIPGKDNEYLLLEWFEEKECKNKTLWCLGKYMKVTQYQINEQNIDSIPNKKLTINLLSNKLNFIKLGEYVKENRSYCPLIYDNIKKDKSFEGDLQ